MLKTKYQKSVAWLEPFVLSAKGLVPIHKLAALKGFRVPLNKVEDIDGQTLTVTSRSFVITLRTFNHIYRANSNGTHTAYRHKKCPTEHMLWTLAHELAHLKEWEHSPKHLKLIASLIRRFCRVLCDLGVSDVSVKSCQKQPR